MANTPPTPEMYEKVTESKLEGGTALGNTLTYGHDSLAERDGPTTMADDRTTKAIMRKLDWRLLPTCSVLYLFSFLDRTA